MCRVRRVNAPTNEHTARRGGGASIAAYHGSNHQQGRQRGASNHTAPACTATPVVATLHARAHMHAHAHALHAPHSWEQPLFVPCGWWSTRGCTHGMHQRCGCDATRRTSMGAPPPAGEMLRGGMLHATCRCCAVSSSLHVVLPRVVVPARQPHKPTKWRGCGLPPRTARAARAAPPTVQPTAHELRAPCCRGGVGWKFARPSLLGKNNSVGVVLLGISITR